MKGEGIGKPLQPSVFPERDSSVVFRVSEATPRETVETCGDRRGRIVPCHPSVSVEMAMRWIVLVTIELKVDWEVRSALPWLKRADSRKIDSRETVRFVVWQGAKRHSHEVADHLPNGAPARRRGR